MSRGGPGERAGGSSFSQHPRCPKKLQEGYRATFSESHTFWLFREPKDMVFLKYQVHSVLPPHWQQHRDHFTWVSGAADHLSRGMPGLTRQASLKPWPTSHSSPYNPMNPTKRKAGKKKTKLEILVYYLFTFYLSVYYLYCTVDFSPSNWRETVWALSSLYTDWLAN